MLRQHKLPLPSHLKGGNRQMKTSTKATANMLAYFYLIPLVVGAKVTFEDVSLSSFYEPISRIASSNSLKEHLPKDFTQSIVVTGKITVLRENSVADIDNVQELHFLRNGIEDIEPGAFKNLTSVTSLTISQSRVKTIREGVFDGLHLKELQVSFTRIWEVSKTTFGDLPELQRLSLTNNELESVEENAFDHLNSMQILDLSNNKLSKLPNDILRNLPNLQMLILRGNEIQETNFGSLSVDHLDLSFNSLKRIPETLFESFPNLKRLALAFNNLTTIPSGVFNNQSVQQLELNNNKISSIDAEAFDDMPDLANIILTVNKIARYNPRWFHNTPNIYRLFLTSNLIEDLPDEAFRNIYNNKRQWIKLDNNKIRTISVKTFKGFKKINNLNLANNKISVWNDKFLEDAEVVDFLNLLDNEIPCPEGDFDLIFKANSTYLNENPLTSECLERIEEWRTRNPAKIVGTGKL